MAIITSGTSTPVSDNRTAPSGLLQEIRMFWRQFFVAAFDPYRPELHYMRGPGPACLAKSMSKAKPKTKPASSSH